MQLFPPRLTPPVPSGPDVHAVSMSKAPSPTRERKPDTKLVRRRRIGRLYSRDVKSTPRHARRSRGWARLAPQERREALRVRPVIS